VLQLHQRRRISAAAMAALCGMLVAQEQALPAVAEKRVEVVVALLLVVPLLEAALAEPLKQGTAIEAAAMVVGVRQSAQAAAGAAAVQVQLLQRQ
jgi:hypothetical protein